MLSVTGASGRLGGLVLDGLLKVVPAEQLVAMVRSPEKAGRFASRGVQVRRGDYATPQTLAPALSGVKRLLLVSGTELGKRVEQHRAVIEAAKEAGVELIGSNLEKQLVATTPLGRLGQPVDVARIAVFLASDEAGWLTGAWIPASGGLQ